MSVDIYTKPDLAKKVEEEEAEWVEREVDIYYIRDDPMDFQSQEAVSAGPQTQNDRPFHRKSFRGAALCLGVLCLLVTAVIIFLSIHFTTENEQPQNGSRNLNNQSRSEEMQLQAQIEKLCSDGRRFESSCYFKSTDKKSWSESRRDCENRGSDLVMINSKEEQKFVSELNTNEESWIGLRTIENKTSSTGFQWEWVDDSPLTETFWATAELENPTNWFAAVCCDQRGKWTRSGYNKNPDTAERNWICEKKISCS